MIRIKIFGYRGKFSQTQNIENHLIKNYNCEISEEPDLLINTTGPFSDSEIFYNQLAKKPIRLYCLLDLDPWKPIEWYNQIKQDLQKCEIPCVISQTVKQDVEQKLEIKNLNVIYYPIRPIKYLNYVKSVEFLYSGRLYSLNKRFQLVLETLDVLGVPRQTLVVAGTEKPPFGVFLNGLDDSDLNELFNCSRFLLSPSSSEGLNLNMIQAVIANVAPILANDCEVNKEFGLEKFCAAPNPESLAKKINEIYTNQKYYYDILTELRTDFEKKFSLNSICQNILNLYNNYKNA